MSELTPDDAKRKRNAHALRRIIALIEKKHEAFFAENRFPDGGYININYSRGFMYYQGCISAHASNYISACDEACIHRGIKISCSIQSDTIACSEVGISDSSPCKISCPDYEEANLDKLASEILHYLSIGKIPKNNNLKLQENHMPQEIKKFPKCQRGVTNQKVIIPKATVLTLYNENFELLGEEAKVEIDGAVHHWVMTRVEEMDWPYVSQKDGDYCLHSKP